MSTHLDEILQALGGHRTADDEIMVHCCAHEDPNPSLSITSKGGKLLAKCFAGCDQSSVVDALKARGLWPETVPRQDTPDGIPATWRGGRLTTKWLYRDQDNTPLGIVARYDGPGGKEIIPFFRRDGGKWASGAAPVPRPLYGLDELPRFDGDILIVEGEKAADAAQRLAANAVALTWPGGSNAVKKADWPPLRGKNVIVWPDNDEPGLKAARDVAEACRKAGAASVRVLTPPSGKPKGWDAADAVAEGWTREMLTAWLAMPEESAKPDLYLSGIFNGAALLEMELPEVRWAVPGLLPQGLAILAGGPKLGKSWLIYSICAGMGAGCSILGQFQTPQARSLYLALEDGQRRLQDRLRALCQNDPDIRAGLSNVDFQITWPRFDDEGGLEKLEEYIVENVPLGLKLVVVDTLAKVMPKAKSKGLNAYESDSLIMGRIKSMADKHGVCILIVTHLSKLRTSKDPFDSITGSMGQFGTADTAMLLTRKRGAPTATLQTTGRDIEGNSYSLSWSNPGWTCAGLANEDELSLSAERLAVLNVFKAHDEPISSGMVAAETGKSLSNTSKLIKKLVEEGFLFSSGYGLYSVQSGQCVQGGKSIQSVQCGSLNSFPSFPSVLIGDEVKL